MAAKSSQSSHFVVIGLKTPEKANVEHRLEDFYAQSKFDALTKDKIVLQTKKALMPYGYFRPDISVVLPTKHQPGRVHVRLGPQMRITHFAVQISGPGQQDCEILRELRLLPIKKGDGFNSILYEEAKNKLTAVAEDQGYLNSTFEQSYVYIDENNNQVSIFLHFDTGMRSYFGKVTFFTGLAKPTPPVKDMPKLLSFAKIMDFFSLEGHRGGLIPQKAIRISNTLLSRYIPFQYGCPYSNQAIVKLDSNLQASGYFKKVNITPATENPGSVPIKAYLEPVERFTYTISGGYGTDTGARGRLGLHVTPINSLGHKLDFLGQASSYQNAAQLKYIIPGRDPMHDQYNINGGFNNLNYLVGNSRSGSLSLLHQHITPKFQRMISLNALQEDFHYIKYMPNHSTVFYPKLILTWRRVSDPLFSPSGYNITVNGLAASKAVFSKLNVLQLMLDVKGALTFEKIRTRIYGHIIQATTQTGNIYDVPLSIAQLLGGPENLKGFSFSSIGPGKVLSYGGIELQKETFDKWYVTGFIDSGSVYTPEPRITQYDIGVGLMWVSPIGPIKLAVAHPTDSHLNLLRDKGVRFVVNMGSDL